jgi:rhodanese-related sulfurtransferase
MLRTLQRACLIAFCGILVGGAHAVLTTKPIKLKPDEVVTELPPRPMPGQGQGQGQGTQSTGSVDAPQVQAAQPRVLGLDITLDDALELQKMGAMFVDARDRTEFEAGHIDGAFWLPAKLFYESSGKPEALNFVGDTNTILVIYCGGGACDASHNTARLLQEVGYKRTHVLTEGYPAWVDRGLATNTGKPFYE